eukprot:CAMPEP_0194299280 /NCGR_PEP_ID=MMETSP0169-20130528/60628_1 /TAXON_ID=218684 /ORGANISM="Corethron pennatum, Strain L29A3" /LENGTH=1179 /DNA_ID=CAMNT_0039049363 /DNA_START=197 /DNA_END=3736 /DNA_ORIENTATION=+
MFDADDGASFLGSSPSPSPPRRSRSPSPGPLSLPPFLPVPHVSHTAVASGGAGTASRPRLHVPFPPPPPHRLSAREGDLIDLGGHVETNATNGKLALVDGSGNVVTSSGLILQHGAAIVPAAPLPARSLHPKLGPGPVERAMARARAMSIRPKPPVVEIVEEDDEEDGEIEIPNPSWSRRRSGVAAREIRHYSDFDPAVDAGVLSGPAGMAVMSVPSVTGGTAGHDVMEVDCEHPGAIGRWRERLTGRACPRAISQQGGNRIQDVVSMFGGVNSTPGRPVQSQHWGDRIPSAHYRSSSASVSSFSQAGLKHIQNLGFRFTRRGSAVRAWLLAFAALLGLGTLVAINMAERGAMWKNSRNLDYENYGAYVLNSATNAGEPRPSSLSGSAVYVTYTNGDAEPGGAWDEFVYWADQHGRRYRSQHEQVGRFRVWSQNHERIKEKNRLHGPCPLTGALVFGDTYFKDLSPEEFKARHLNGYKPPVTHTSKKAKMAKMAQSPGGPSADPASKATGLSHHNPSRQVHHQHWGDMGWTSMHAEWKRILREKGGQGKSTEATGRRLSSKRSGSMGSKYETHKRTGAKMSGKVLATAKGQSQPLGSQYETRKRIDHWDGSGAQMTGKMQATAKGQIQPLGSQYETRKRIDHWDGSGAQMTGEMKTTSMGQGQPLGSQYETSKRIDHWDGSGAQMTGEMKATSMGQSQPLGSQYETRKRIDHWDGSGAQMTGEMQATAKGQSQPLGSQYETSKRIDHWDGSGAQMTGEMKATSMGQSQPLGSQYETHKRIDPWDGSGAPMAGETQANPYGDTSSAYSSWKYRENRKKRYIDSWTSTTSSTSTSDSWKYRENRQNRYIDKWTGSYGSSLDSETKKTSSFTLWSCGWNALCWMRWIVAGTSMGFTSEPVYDSESYPTMVDWRQVGAVTSIHTQGYCGACWAITAVESIESAYFLYTGLLMDLYEAEVIACDDSCEMCDGGWPQNAYDYVVEMGGLPKESGYDDVFLVAMTAGDGNEYGYSTDSFDSFMDKTCPSSQYYEGVERYAAIKSYSYVTDRCVCYTDGSGCDCDEQDESTAVRNVASYGPASICIDASVMQDYTGGIITSDSGCSSEFMSMNHCVQVVGYAYTDGSGDEESGSNSGDGNENNAQREGYWIIRNQWGNSWGMNGYAYMAMGDNTCGILNDMTQPFFD